MTTPEPARTDPKKFADEVDAAFPARPVTSTDSEGAPWGSWETFESSGLTADQSLRAAALHAASAYLSGRPQDPATSYRDELCALADSLMPWLRTGERS